MEVYLLLSENNIDERLQQCAVPRSSSFLLDCVVCVPAVFQPDNLELAGRELFSGGPIMAAPDCYQDVSPVALPCRWVRRWPSWVRVHPFRVASRAAGGGGPACSSSPAGGVAVAAASPASSSAST